MTPTPRKLSENELADIVRWHETGQPPLNCVIDCLLAHIAALEAEWPICQHGIPIFMSHGPIGGDYDAHTHTRNGCGYCEKPGRGKSASAALAAFRAANRKTEFGGYER